MGRYYLHNDHEDGDDGDDDNEDGNEDDRGSLSMITTAMSFVYQPRHEELRHEEIEEIPNDDDANYDDNDNGYQDMDCDDSYDYDRHDENDHHDYHDAQNTESEQESEDDGDGDDNSDQQQQERSMTPTVTTSTALWTRSPATTHGGVTPVQHHYHVYVPPPSRQSSYCGRFFTWWLLVWIILVSHLIQRYGPPAPPPTIPEHTTWTDLFQHQYQVVSNLVKTWGHELPAHVSYWCWQGIQDDVHHTILPFISFSKHINKCPWRIPTSPTAIQSQVVGQEIAVERVFHAIKAWKQDTPLLLYLTGRPGVGKRHLIKTLAHTLYDDCDDSPLFHLKSKSDHAYGYDTQPEASSLYQQTLDHVLGHSKPSVIMLEHVEQLPAGSFLHFVQQVQSSAAFHSTVLIFTSNVGVRSMDRCIQRYGGDIASIPQAELQSYISYEVGLFHNDETEDEGTANVSLVSTDYV